MARAAVRVGRVWQARERTLEVEEKDAVPLSFEAGETRLHGPAPLRVVGADVAGLRVFDWGKAEKDRALFGTSHPGGVPVIPVASSRESTLVVCS